MKTYEVTQFNATHPIQIPYISGVGEIDPWLFLQKEDVSPLERVGIINLKKNENFFFYHLSLSCIPNSK